MVSLTRTAFALGFVACSLFAAVLVSAWFAIDDFPIGTADRVLAWSPIPPAGGGLAAAVFAWRSEGGSPLLIAGACLSALPPLLFCLFFLWIFLVQRAT